MRTILQSLFFFSIIVLSCSNHSSELPVQIDSQSPCPIDTCQKAAIELSLQGLNYSAPFSCYEWADWGTGMEVNWSDGGRILFFTFPNHRICNSEYRICVEEICECNWQPIESCPRNNAITIPLDSCLFGQSTLFLDVFLQDS